MAPKNKSSKSNNNSGAAPPQKFADPATENLSDLPEPTITINKAAQESKPAPQPSSPQVSTPATKASNVTDGNTTKYDSGTIFEIDTKSLHSSAAKTSNSVKTFFTTKYEACKSYMKVPGPYKSQFWTNLFNPLNLTYSMKEYFTLQYPHTDNAYVASYEMGIVLSLWACIPLHIFAQYDYYAVEKGYGMLSSGLYAGLGATIVLAISAHITWLVWYLITKRNCMCAPFLVLGLAIVYILCFILSVLGLLPPIIAIFSGTPISVVVIMKSILLSFLQILPWVCVMPCSYGLSKLYLLRKENGWIEGTEADEETKGLVTNV